MVDPDNTENELNPLWQGLLSGNDPRLRRGRRMFRLMSPTAAETVMSEAIWRTLSQDMVVEPCNLELKGYVGVQRAYIARLPSATR